MQEPLRAKLAQLRECAGRYRRFADFLTDDPLGLRLQSFAVEVVRQADEFETVLEKLEATRRRSATLRVELADALAKMRLLFDRRFTVEQVREASRLCREEAQAAPAIAEKHQFAVVALDLAQLAEAMDRAG